MHVGLNLIFLVPGATGGTETYARELIPELVAAAPHIAFTAFVSREGAHARGAPWLELMPSVIVPVDSRRRLEWVRGEQECLPRMARARGVRMVHSLANTGPVWGRYRRVLTVHDLHHRLVPEAHQTIRGVGMRITVSAAVRRSHRIIVPATVTADDLARCLGVPGSVIDVVPEGIGTVSAVRPVDDAELRRNLEIGARAVVLCVAAKRPHKNLARVISAIARFPPTRRPILVMPGYWTPHAEELRRHAAALGVERDVRLLGWVCQEELEALYRTAAVLVCPSLHEGFGLPVLEAMARDVPVVCSERGALAEVAGEAAVHCDPLSEWSIAAAIDRVLGSGEEANRLRVAGRRRVRAYSWAQSAVATVRSYERAVGAYEGCDRAQVGASSMIGDESVGTSR